MELTDQDRKFIQGPENARIIESCDIYRIRESIRWQQTSLKFTVLYSILLIKPIEAVITLPNSNWRDNLLNVSIEGVSVNLFETSALKSSPDRKEKQALADLSSWIRYNTRFDEDEIKEIIKKTKVKI